MCCIIYNFKTISVSYLLHRINITHIPIYMYRNDCRSLIGNERFYLIYINRIIIRIYVALLIK